MEVRQLEYLVAVVDHGGFTSAAAAVHVAQPSISQAIRSLERSLGLELFVRAGRTVRLTPAGEVIVERARLVLRDLGDVTAAAAALRGVDTGRLDVVALPTLAVNTLAGLLGRLRHRHPGLQVRVHEPEESATLAGWVRSGRAEVGITDLATAGDDLEHVDLQRQDIVAVCPPGTPDDRPLSADDVAALPLVAAPRGTSTRRLLDEVLERSDREPTIVVETDQREAIVPLVLAGAGTALLPAGLAGEARARGASILRLRPPVARQVVLVHRAGVVSPAAAALLALARPVAD